MQNALSTPPQPSQPAVSANQQQPNVPRQAPAPTHEQTVAALRHMHAISAELRTIMRDPNFGKASIKSAIIDGAAKLVASRILSPAEAVQQLAQVPDRPFDQKKWVEQNYVQTTQAMTAVLSHHAQSAVGTGDYKLETLLHEAPDVDKHQETIRGMMSAHYA